MNNKIMNIIKFVLVYIHRYAGLWCIIMGYVVLFGLVVFGSMINFETLREIGILFVIVIILASLFAEDKFEKNVYRSFGVWW